MINKDVFLGSTSSDLVKISEAELSARLGGYEIDDDTKNYYIQQFNKCVTYRFAYAKVSYSRLYDLSYFENEIVYSQALGKVMQNSKEAILLVVSSGVEVDKLINKYSIQSKSAAYIFDAIASAAIESYMDYIIKQICAGLNVTKRFSPGYADFSIEFQRYLLNRLSAGETVGVALSPDFMMIPSKSITAVIGIE